MSIETSINNYISDNLLHGVDVKDLSSDDSLLNAGLLDSASIFQLVAFLETEFSLEIPDEEVVPDNFESIDAIVRFVKSRKEADTS